MIILKKLRFWLPALLSLILGASPSAHSAEEIAWKKLAPPVDFSLNPGIRLTPARRRDLNTLWTVRKQKAGGNSSPDLDTLEKKSIAALESGGFDAELLLRQKAEYVEHRRSNGNKLVESMNGKRVKLAGYLLPTEFNGDKIVEFLLVPSYGACVHTPPPARNQLIHVKLDEGIDNLELFAAVEVSGRISTEVTRQQVAYSDGQAAVEAGYSMAATEVVLYGD